MAADRDWWEPPMDGSEDEHIFGALDRLRATFRWKADGLDADGMAHRIPSSSLTLGGLLRHLALVEDRYAAQRIHGTDLGAPWYTAWDGGLGLAIHLGRRGCPRRALRAL